ncbi:beta strand repeat-containing protein, partial [Croceivirga lutea]|uniref:beta strand repeat-containing protein n=1 Tax=Croceivirga lutea TaxID=1775167 RepID=UPI00163A3436
MKVATFNTLKAYSFILLLFFSCFKTLGNSHFSKTVIGNEHDPTIVEKLVKPTTDKNTFVGDVQFSSPNYTIDEDGGSLTVEVTYVGPDQAAFTIDYATLDNTAIAGTDYTATSGTLSFSGTAETLSFSVPILDNTFLNAEKEFQIDLSNISEPTITVSQSTTVAIINDNELTPTTGLSVSDFSVDESTATALFTISYSGATVEDAFTVDYVIADGTATSGTDYTATLTGQLSFLANTIDGDFQTVSVNLIDDLDIEGDETLTLTISNTNPNYIPIVTAIGTGTISDNDSNAGTGIAVDNITVNEADGTFDFSIYYTGNDVQDAFTVDYVITDGSATSGTDYTATLSGQITFPAGTADTDTQTVTITLIDDTDIESDEILTIDLSNISHSALNILDANAIATITDNDPTVTDEISVADFSIDEAAGTASFVVTYTGTNGQAAFTLDYTITDGSAISGSDYSATLTGQVSFPTGTNSGDQQAVVVTLTDDALIEGDEDLTFTLANSSNPAITIVDASATGTITDNDTTPGTGVSVADFSVDEAAGTVDFVVTYTGNDVQDAFTVDYLISDISTTSGTDYTATLSGQITFPAGTADTDTQTVTITLIDDTDIESDEILTIDLSNISHSALNILDANAIATITDNDPTVTDEISVADFSIDEAAGTASFVVTYTGTNGQAAFTLDYTITDGSAISGSDYSATLTGQVSFPTGTNSGDQQAVVVTLTDDALIEGDEDLTLTLANSSNPAITIVDANATGTITDNDTTPGTGVSVADFSVDEAAGTVDFVVTYTGNDVQDAFTVDYLISDISTTSGTDYTATLSGQITFPAGTADTDTQTVTITITDDTDVEGDESLDFTLSNISNTLLNILDASATGTITDNDPAIADEISVADFSIDEAAGTASFVVTYTGTNGQAAFTLDYTITDGSAISGSDYSATLTGQVSFPTGTNSGDQQAVVVTLTDDALIEGDEDLTLTLANSSNPAITIVDANATGTITDNDTTPGTGVSVADFSVDEAAGTVDFVVTYTGNDVQDAFTVDYLISDISTTSGTDYTATLSGQITFPAGTADTDTQTVTITITDDADVEGDESLDFTLSNISNTLLNIIDASATGTITDNDPAIADEISVADFSIDEAAGTASFVVTYTGTNGQAAFTLDYTITDGSAISGSDYSATLTGQVSFPTGTNSGDQQAVVVTLTDDALIEGDEDLTLTLANSSNPAITIVDASATGTITDNDTTPGTGVSVADFSVDEAAGTVDFVVTYTGNDVQDAFTVDYLISDISTTSGTDYTATLSGQITFPAGTADTDTQTVTITITDDTDVEGDESLDFTLSNISNTLLNIIDASATGTITDNDVATSGSVSVADFSVNENSGTVDFVVTYTGITVATPFTFDYVIADGTANSGSDYAVTLTGQISFPAGTNDGDQQVVTVTLVDDAVVETDETFDITISNSSTALVTIADGTGTGTILNDDVSGTVEFFNTNVTFTEGTDPDAIVTISYNGTIGPGQFVDFDINSVEGTATEGIDYGGGSLSHRFDDSNFGTPISIIIPLADDTTIESDEDFQIELSNLTTNIPGGVAFANGQPTYSATVTINDNDSSTVEIINGPVIVTEGTDTFARFTVVYNGTLTGLNFVRFDWSTLDGTAEDGTDYVGDSGFLLYGAIGGYTRTIDIDITDDAVIESAEEFQLILTNLTSSVGAQFDNGQPSYPATATLNDNDSGPSNGVSVADFTVDEDAGTANFVVTYNGNEVQDAFTVDYTITDVSTVSGTDYTATLTGQVAFPAGTEDGDEQNIVVTITDDTFLEEVETLEVTLSNLSTTLINILDADATGTINDNDSTPTTGLSVLDFTVNENAVSTVFNVVYNGATTQNSFTVDYVITDGSANIGSDYNTVASGTLSFPASTDDGDAQSISVSMIDDTLIEGNEDLTFTLSNISTSIINLVDADGLGTIIDNEIANASTGVSIADFTVDEAIGTVDFVVSYNGATVQDAFTVDYAITDGTANSGSDYNATLTGQLAFPAGTTSGDQQTVTVTIIDDTAIEGDQDLNGTLSNLSTTLINIVDANGVGTITDNDVATPTTGLTAADFSVDESIGTTNFVVTYNGATIEQAFTVDYTITDGSANSGTDYTATLTGQLTFPAGTADGDQQNIAVTISEDTVIEGDETIDFVLSGLSTTLINLVDANATGTIQDNDVATPTTGVSAADFTVDEDAGTVNFVVTYNGATIQDGFTVDYAITDVTTTSGSDYTATLTGQLSFPAGTTDGDQQNVSLAIIDDNLLEENETVDFTLSNLSTTLINIVDADASGTINDNDSSPTTGLSVLDFTVNENALNTNFTVVYSGATTQNSFTVDYVITDGSASIGSDYNTVASGTLTFAANTTNGNSRNVAVSLLDDTLLEGNEDLTITLSNVSTANINLVDADGLGTIIDNEIANASTGVSIADFTVDEAIGTVDFVVSYNGATVQDAFTVDYAITDGTANSGSDYNATLSGQLAFPAGTTSGDQQTITVTIIDDTAIEGDQDLNGTLSNLSTTLINIVDANGVGTITDNDVATPTTGLTAADFSVDESIGTTNFVVTYNGATIEQAFTVDYTITDGSANSGTDYTATLTGQLTFPAGTADGDQQNVAVTISEDTVIEGDETIDFLLSGLSTTLINLVDANATGTIQDNDVATPTTGVSAADFTVDEDAGTVNFVVTYNGATIQNGFTVDYAITDVTTTSGSDYTATLTGQLSFPAGTADGDQQNVSLAIADDNILEGTETVDFTLSNLSTTVINIVDGNAVGTINDNEATAGTGVSAADFTVNENGLTAQFELFYSGATVQDAFTVDYTITNGSAVSGTDFNATLTGTVTFPAGTTNGDSRTVTVTIIDDARIEGNEDLSITFSNSSLAVVPILDADGLGTIIDNDVATPTTGLTVSDFSVSESIGTVNFVVRYNGATVQNAFTVDYAITDGTANSGSDYTATLAGQLSFPANTTNGTQRTVTLTISDDTVIEGTENLNFQLSNLSNSLINLVDPNAVGTITDNDIKTPTTGISVADFTVDEAVGTTNFVVTYNGADVEDEFTVNYSITDGSANSGSDYSATLAGQITFPAGTTNGDLQNVAVTITDDAFIEGDEDLDITLSGLSTTLINLVDGNATGTIQDNDLITPTTGLTVADFSANESVGTVDFVVTYNGASIQNSFTVDYSIFNGTAASGSDYTATLSGQLTFPAGTVDGDQQTVTVTILNDGTIEGDEDFRLELANLSNPSLNLVDSEGVGTILDDDIANASTGISVLDFSVNESAGTINMVVTYSGATVQNSFTVDYVIADDSAIHGVDYNTVQSGQLVFPNNTSNGNQQLVSVAILEDTLIEGNENVTITLSNLSTTLVNLIDANGIGTINDNDTALPSTGLSVSDFTVNENVATADFIVTYNGATVQDEFTVDYAITDGSANSGIDYNGTLSGTLTFAAGTTDGTQQNISVSITNDALIEGDEDVDFTLSNLSTTLLNLVDATGVGTIIDDDTATPTTGISVADFTVDESVGSTQFVVTYNGATLQDGFTVDYEITDISTTSGNDYSATLTGQLTFPAGTADGDQQTIPVTINEDTFIEQNESLNIQLSNLSSLLINTVDGQALGTINDNDNNATTGIDFTSLAVSSNEGDPGDTVNAIFTITFNGDVDAGENIEVDYLVNNGTAFNSTDFTASPTVTTLVFNNVVKTHNVIIPIINDNVIELTESYNFDLVAIRSNVGIQLLNNRAVGTINDDDGGGLSIAGFNVVEQSTVRNFEITYNGDTTPGGFTIDYVVTDGTAASGDDYTVAVASGTLTFTGNNGEVRSVPITILEDSFIEFDETLEITISNPSNPQVGISSNTATGIIGNNDSGSIAITGFTVDEIFTTENFEFTYTGDPVQGGFAVNYQIVDVTTSTGNDYTVSSQTGTLNFTGTDGQVIQVPVDILQDAIIEGNENLRIEITGITPSFIGITNASAVGTILDIDHQPTAEDDSFVVFRDQSNKVLDVLPNDDYGFDGPAAVNALQIVSPPSNGTLTVNNNGTPGNPLDDYFDYQPNPSFNGYDSFIYQIVDSNGSTVSATAYLYINDTNLKKDFEIRFQGNVHGDFTMIANNVLSRNATADYNGGAGNHNFNDNVFVDIDSDPTTFNSTRANLANPEPTLSCLNIERAYIYWAAADKPYGVDGFGLTTGTGNTADEPTWNFNEIKLMLPGQSSYTTIAADEVLYRGRDEGFQNDPYVCVKDITAEVNALATPFGNYQVGNIKATELDLYSYSGSHTGTSGGWQIVFVYENISLDPKNITLYDGYVHTYASNGEGETEFNFSGFQTIPAGNVNTGMIIGSLEGDQDLGGDQLLINDTSSNWTNISTPMRAANNFFNSRITIDGLDYTDRSPASTNTLGYDAAKFQLNNSGNSLIGNDQTFARFKITTDQESYGLYLMGMSVDVYQPSLGALSLTANATGPFNAGDIVPLSLDVTNSGNDDIINLSISTVIPDEAEFVGVGTLPAGVTHNYDSATRTLEFTSQDGITNMGDSYQLDFDIQLKDQCYFLETACSASFEVQATASFSGTTNTDMIVSTSSGTTDACGIGEYDPTIIDVQQPAQVNWATVVGSLDRTISCDNITQYNAAQALEPVPAICSFTVVKVPGSFVQSASCPSEGTYTNVWTFTDACGRVSDTYTQVITVEDNAAPTFNESLPADSFAAYDNVPAPQTLTANDNCDTNATVNFSESYIGDNSGTDYTIVRTWSTTDCAGNNRMHTQNIFVTENGAAIGVAINDITVNEIDGTATLEVTNTGNVTGGYTVTFSTANGSAQQPGDYTSDSGTLTFTGNHNEVRTITIAIGNDNLIEPTEDFTVNIANGTNTPTINKSAGVITILDNDNVVGTGVSFDSNSITVTEGTDTFARFTVTFTGNIAPGENVTFDYNTSDGSAEEPADYLEITGTGVFTSSTNTVFIDVPIIDDNVIEQTENLIVLLTNVQSNIGVGFVNGQPANTATANILDNDNQPGVTGLSFQGDPVIVNEADGTATVIVELTGNVQGGFSVDYNSANNNAEAGSDYSAVTGTLNFAGNDGESYPITIPIIDDNVIEATEDLFVNLSNLSTSLIAINDNQAVVQIIDNDNTPGTNGISFQNNPITVNEADGTATINVLLNGNVQGGFTLDYVTRDDSADAGSDYNTVSGTLTFAGNDGEIQQVVIPILDDNIIEATERFYVDLSNLSTNLITINDANASVDILDNDYIPGVNGISFQNDAITVNEAAGTASINVVLNGNVQGGFDIDYATNDNTAEAGTDYTTVSGTLSFAGNDGEVQTITVPIIDDNVIEATERLFVNLSNLSTTLITINDNQATVDIIDNDNIPGTTGITFENDAIVVDEAVGIATINVLLTGNVQGGFDVDYTTNDNTAISGDDYTTSSGRLSFAGTDGEIQTISVPIIDDNNIEPTEQLFIDLFNLSTPLITINDAQGTVDITDNDNIPGTTGISFQNDAVSVSEDDGTATIDVLLTGNVPGGFTIDFTTNNNTAIAGLDYTTTNGTLTFAGTDGEIQSITVPITDDNIIEATEQLLVDLSNLSTSLIAINDSQGTIDILDNDAIAGTGIAFDNANVTVNEADGTMTFDVRLTGNVQGGFTVNYTTADGSAVEPSDYTETSGTLTFAGTDGEVHSITVPINDDNVIEATENLTVTLSGLSTTLIGVNGPSNANGNIIDNDANPGVTGISFDNSNVTVNEADGTMTFDVVLNGNVQGGFSVDYATADGSANQPNDYTQTSGTLTFVGNNGEVHTITVPIIDDTLIEPTEDLTVSLSNLSTTLIGVNGPTTATGNILDNDAIAGTGIAFDNDNVTVNEADGTMTFDVVLTGNVQGGFSVDFATADGTANEPSDYTETIGTLTFTGTDGEVQTITTPIIDDTLIEPTEDLTVSLSGLSTTLIGINGPTTATGNILDNDAVAGTGISFDNTNVTVNEADGTMNFDVVLTGNVQGGFTVDYATTDGTANEPGDYTETIGTLTFVGTDGEVQTISIPILDDDIIEPTEDLIVSLSGLSTTLIGINGPSSATGNILDNDNTPGVTGISFDSDNVTVNEADGTITFNVTLTGNVQGGFSVDYASADGSANQPSDYTATIGTLNFIGTNGETYPITIPIVDDDIIEATENFTVSLSGLTTTLIGINGPSTATGNIIDNDATPGVTGIRFDSDNVTVNEADGTMTFDVTLTGNVQGGFTVDYATTDGTANEPFDYTDTTGTLTFVGTDGESHSITVPVVDDDLIEPTEDLTVALSGLSTTLITINGPSTATGNIIDNDATPGVTGISFDNTNVTVNEADGTMNFDVVLNGNVQGGFAVDYATTNGSAAEPGDYTETIGTLNFVGTNGEVQTISVPIVDDDLIEPTEDLTVALSGLSTTLITINGPTTATGNIIDNDATPGVTGIRFDSDNVTVNESDGTLNFDVVLTGNVQGGFSVDFATTDGSALEPFDYQETIGTLNFVGVDGEVQTISIPILDDDLIEPTEDLTVSLSGLSTTLITINGPTTATGNIIDNDATPGVTGIRFDSDNVTVNEADGTMTFDVVLTGNVQGGFSVDYATADGTANEPGDYTATSGTLVFTGTDGETQTITVPIFDDNIIEATETLTVSLSGLSTTLITINGSSTATGNIIDNDNIPGVTGISFDNDSVVVNEGDGTATINVLLTGNVQGGVTVDYTTTDNTAEEASDYTLTTGTLTFVGTDGEIQPITVPITDDDIIEATEQFFVDLSNLVTNTPITITDNQATVDILDNDNIPGVTGISFDNDSVVVNEGDGTAT